MALLNSLKNLFTPSRLDVPARFSLLREAISGTMSNFYMARDLESGKIVGLKIIHLDRVAAFHERFKGLHKPTEGEISMQLRHPHIVQTFEYGLTTNGSPYLVMEFLEGPDLNSAIVSQMPVLEGRRLRYLRQAAEALAAVHAAGFIHRDMCPRNLMLTDHGESVKLIDFGLTVPATAPFMAPGNRTGTPNYMAPELVRRRPTDQRLDVFAFGVTAFEICTGTLPWPRGTTGMAAMTHDQPPTDIRTHRPQIDPRLAAAIHACIEPEPKRRCPSMADFLLRIEPITQEDAVTAEPGLPASGAEA